MLDHRLDYGPCWTIDWMLDHRQRFRADGRKGRCEMTGAGCVCGRGGWGAGSRGRASCVRDTCNRPAGTTLQELQDEDLAGFPDQKTAQGRSARMSKARIMPTMHGP
eukprot:2063363-Pleurochrysis_carterae.AAC.1